MKQTPRYDLIIEKGRDFREYIGKRLTDGTIVDLTGYTFKAKIRVGLASTSTLIKAFTIDTAALAAGDIYLVLTDTDTAAITQSTGYWDLRVTDPTGNVESWLWGEVTIEERPTDNA